MRYPVVVLVGHFLLVERHVAEIAGKQIIEQRAQHDGFATERRFLALVDGRGFDGSKDCVAAGDTPVEVRPEIGAELRIHRGILAVGFVLAGRSHLHKIRLRFRDIEVFNLLENVPQREVAAV